ncbi:MAG: ABC transporter permease [Azospirillaceae bacterium]
MTALDPGRDGVPAGGGRGPGLPEPALKAAWAAVVWGLPAVVILAPLAAFLVYAFWYTDGPQVVRDFTLRNFVTFVENDSYTRVFLKTLGLAVQVMLVNLALGYAVAYQLWRMPARWRYTLVLALAVPLLMSYIIKIYAMRGVLGTNGIINATLVFLGVIEEPLGVFLFNLTAVRITLSVVLLPFMALPIFVALEKIPATLLQASDDLGATRWQTFRNVVLPLSLPGATIGAMFTFVLAVGDFLAPELVGGVQGFTYGRLVFSQFGMAFNWPFGAALSVVLLGVALVVIVVAARAGSPKWQRP